MAADTYDPFLGLILQGTGNNNNNWGEICNSAMVSPVARAIAGVVTHSNTGGSLDLSGSPPPATLRQDVDMIQLFNGSLTGDLTVTVPNISKLWWFQNNTSGSYNLFVKTPGGTAPPNLVQIPQGLGVMVMCDGNSNLTRQDDAEIGSFRISGKASAGAGELACNGASLLKAKYPNLSAKIGTTWGSADSLHFTLPLLTDTGRFLRSSTGSLSVGTYQSSQNKAHTHPGASFSGTTGNDNQPHYHTFSGTTSTMNSNTSHTHGVAGGFMGGTATGGSSGGSIDVVQSHANIVINSTNIDHTHPFSGNTDYPSTAHNHNYTGTTGTIPSDGGSEARPESAAVLICIKY